MFFPVVQLANNFVQRLIHYPEVNYQYIPRTCVVYEVQ